MGKEKPKSYSQQVRENLAKTISPDKTGGKFRGKGEARDHICKDRADNFLEHQPKMANFKGNEFEKEIQYHTDATSLNSSQVMCINFFWKFFQKPGDDEILLRILRKSGLEINTDVTITNAIVEYIPNPKEGTNFDFYLKLSDDKVISMEIKYTESGFGGISSYKEKENPKMNRYGDRWEQIYAKLASEKNRWQMKEECEHKYVCLNGGKICKDSCKNINNCAVIDFFENYQINRNIVLAEPGGYVLFLTPQANTTLNSGRRYIDSLNDPSIRNLYWEDVAELAVQETKNDPELYTYYSRFKAKYIDFVPWQLTK